MKKKILIESKKVLQELNNQKMSRFAFVRFNVKWLCACGYIFTR